MNMHLNSILQIDSRLFNRRLPLKTLKFTSMLAASIAWFGIAGESSHADEVAIQNLSPSLGSKEPQETKPLLSQPSKSKSKPRVFTQPMKGPALQTPLSALKANEAKDSSTNSSSAGGAKDADLPYGAFQRGFYLTAFRLALPRAETGDPAAQTLIAELYWNGFGVGRDQKKAVEWYRFAAEGGNREAQFAYANILLRGKLVPLDKGAGTLFMRKAADQKHPQANFNLGQILTAARPTYSGFKSALPYYQFAAEAGVADAQYVLASMHANARGVPYNDMKEAAKWMTRAAEGGFDTAQMEMGIWLATGNGVTKNETQAFEWFSRAALAGNALAQNRLAYMLANGVGSRRDIIRAGAWHIISRRAGFNDSRMERVFSQLKDIDKRRALEAANQLSKRLKRRG